MRARLVTAAVLLAVSLAGCVPGSTPDPSDSSPLPSPTPLFADEEAALAAAEQAYARFLDVSDTILNEGGRDPDRIDAVALEVVAQEEKDGFKSFTDNGYHSTGRSTFTVGDVQLYDPLNVAGEVIRIYACSDISGVDVVDETGASIVTDERPDRTAFELGFSAGDDGGLILSSKDLWSGGGVCV